MNIQHSSRTDSWGSPADITTSARAVLGSIDLDPASSAHWNQNVGAANYFTEAADGLSMSWHGAVFLNPPGGKVKNKSKTGLFWHKLCTEVLARRVTHAIFLAFSLEALQSTQKPGSLSILDFPFCVPRKRLRFVAQGVEQPKAPSHSNVIVYLPGTVDETTRFYNEFSQYGRCRT